MNWDSLDWTALDRLRETFLTGSTGDYWRSRSDLENYDFTYGQRIAWKWNAVLAELRRLEWTPASDTILDWGCGSGIAGRLVRDFFSMRTLCVFDRSRLAMDYAIEAGNAQRWRDGDPVGVLVLSHVLNEFSEADRQQLQHVIERADAVLWVEPGTYADSRALIAMREELRGQLSAVAPCRHQALCGLLASENERHWCHFFAQPPPGVMADPNWVRFAQRVGIDLRSLPYCYLVLDRRPSAAGGARIIGESRFYRGYAKVLRCQSDGVREVTIQKRDNPDLFRRLKKSLTCDLASPAAS
jgi:Mitochondrial small ribosomal subunit Rsm22